MDGCPIHADPSQLNEGASEGDGDSNGVIKGGPRSLSWVFAWNPCVFGLSCLPSGATSPVHLLEIPAPTHFGKRARSVIQIAISHVLKLTARCAVLNSPLGRATGAKSPAEGHFGHVACHP